MHSLITAATILVLFAWSHEQIAHLPLGWSLFAESAAALQD